MAVIVTGPGSPDFRWATFDEDRRVAVCSCGKELPVQETKHLKGLKAYCPDCKAQWGHVYIES